MLSGILLTVHFNAFAERLSVKTYGTPDGLGSSFIVGIIQDSHGFLWICTRDGLSRFDGNKFTTYKTSDGLPVPNTTSILENPDGTFWLTTNGGGVCKLNPEGKIPTPSRPKGSALFTTYSLGDNDISNRANTIYRDREGRIWVGTDDGLFRLEKEGEEEAFKKVPVVIDPLESKEPPVVENILQDSKGDMWVVLLRSGLYRIFKDGRSKHYSARYHSAFAIPSGLIEDRQGRLWLGTSSGLCLVEANSETDDLNVHLYTKKDGLADSYIKSILQTRDGHLWIGTVNGLTEYDGASFRSYDVSNGLGGMLTRLFEDRDGNLWIGSPSNGLMRFARNGFITFGSSDNKSLVDIHNVFEDKAGNMFVVSGNWFVNRISGREVSASRLGMPTSAVLLWLTNAVLRDHVGELWTVTGGMGMFRFADASNIEHIAQTKLKSIYTTKEGLPSNQINHIYEDSRGDIWLHMLGGSSAPLVRWERATEKFHLYTAKDGLPAGTYLSKFYEAPDGTIWLGFSNGRIGRYAQGRFFVSSEPENITRVVVIALFVDSQNRLWIAGASGGVTRIDNPTSDNPTYISYTTAEGLSSDNARCIGEDKWGRIYIGTVRGVDRIDTKTDRIEHFSSADGLSSDFTKLIYRDRQDNLWIGTLNGISKFKPEPPSDTSPPVITISSLRVAGEPYAINELGETEINNLELEAGRNQVEIDFTAPAFRLGETLRFQYRLEGADTDWSVPSDLRTVNYASLSPGSYRFLVRAINGEGIASLKPAAVTFRVLPPFWRRGWFIGLVSLTVALAAFAIVRQRLARRREREQAEAALRQAKEERLRELEQVRRRIAADLHDDIGSNLTRISLLSEVAQRRVDGNNAPVGEQLSNIAGLSRELVDSMSEIVWAINPQKDHLSDLTQKMRHFASDLLTARQIDFRFSATDSDQDIKVGANVRREFFLLFKEGINNIARHSDCTDVEIDFRVEADHLLLTLIDNGKGFDVAKKRAGHGLTSMRERTLALGGRFEIISEPELGTTLKFNIPLALQVAGR